MSVEGPPGPDGTTTKIEYRVWNPFRSKLAAAVLGGVDDMFIHPGAKVSFMKSVLQEASSIRLATGRNPFKLFSGNIIIISDVECCTSILSLIWVGLFSKYGYVSMTDIAPFSSRGRKWH